jgi:hypothetical protein
MISDEMATAWHACLNPDHEAPPTPRQKEAVLQAIAKLCYLEDAIPSQGISPTDMAVRTGMHAVGVAVLKHLERDIYSLKQKRASR